MSNISKSSHRASTATLATFLATTGPAEFMLDDPKAWTPVKQPLFARLLTKKQSAKATPTHATSKQDPIPHKNPKYIALPEYHPTEDSDDNNTKGDNQRDSGVFNEAPSKPENQYLLQEQPGSFTSIAELRFPMPPPTPSHKHNPVLHPLMTHVQHDTRDRSVHFQEHSQHDVFPECYSLGDSFTSPKTSSTQRQSCPHCRQAVPTNTTRPRRYSCPPVVACPGNGAGRRQKPTTFSSQEAKLLLCMIEQLQSKLEEEQRSREKLERVLARRNRRHKLDTERSSWPSHPLP